MQGVITRFTNGATSMPSLMNWVFFSFLLEYFHCKSTYVEQFEDLASYLF